LFYDGTNLGVGTNSPSSYGELAVLSVGNPVIYVGSTTSGDAGAVNIQGSGSGSYPSLNFSQNTTNYWTIGQRGDTNLYLYRQAGSGNLSIPSGNVGIGTNSPTSALVVSGAAQGVPTVNGVHIGTETGYATIELVGTSTTGSLIDFTQSGTDFKGRILYSNTDNHLELDVNGAEAMRITSAGYVGIAQAAPVTYLQVGTGVSNSANYIWAAGNSANPPSSATYGILLGGNLSGGNAESNLIWGQGISSSQYFNIGKWTGSAYTEQMRLSSGGNLSINTTATYNPLGVATPPYLNISGGSLSTTLNAANDWATFYSSTGNATYLRTFVFRNTASVGGWTTATTRIQQIIDVTNQGYIDFNPPGGNNVADIAFGYGSTEYMRINAGGSGYVGIGTTTPTNRFTVAEPTNNDATIYLTATQANRAAIINLNGTLSGYNFIYGRVNGTEDWGIGGGGGTAATLAFYTGSSNSERMRITSGGSVLIGTTVNATNGCLNAYNQAYFGSAYYSGSFYSTDFVVTVAYGSTITQGISFGTTATSGTQTACRFIQNSSTVGSIQTTNTATAFNTSSDYRLKENIAPMIGALSKVTQLKPVTYTWKSDGSEGEGFIAHELAEVVPLAVSGEKDAVNTDGSIKPQGIDTSFLVATLTAAIQEQQQIINDLTARIAKLEGK